MLDNGQLLDRNVRIKLFFRVDFKDIVPIDYPSISGFGMIFGHFVVLEVIFRWFFTKPRLIVACDKNLGVLS
jgi:hypothetical protein